MDIDAEQTDLRHYADAHQQRIDHLQARIYRSIPGAELATARDVRVFLAEYGVGIPAEWDIRVRCTTGDFSVIATNDDDWFPANLSWSSRDGFSGRVTSNSWRALQQAVPAAGA